ncbi:MAG: DUF58 domain-containing protein [Thermoguttaceae bacterium]
MFFHPETLKRLSRLELRARHVVEGVLSGMHASRHFGNSVEFRQHRQYVPGDDPRNVDWKVWARQDRMYVKQYEVDTNLRCMILLDVSPSMQLGSGVFTKYEYACTIAASLALLALKQQDAVGCMTFDDRLRNVLPARNKGSQLGSMITLLQQSEPSRERGQLQQLGQSRKQSGQSRRETKRESTVSFEEMFNQVTSAIPDCREPLLEMTETIPQHGLVVLISDLLVKREGLFDGLRHLRSRNQDVMVLHIMDDQELDFPFNRPVQFEGLDIPSILRCDPKTLRKDYLDAVQMYLDEIKRGALQHQADYMLFRTSDPLDAALSAFLNRRRK